MTGVKRAGYVSFTRVTPTCLTGRQASTRPPLAITIGPLIKLLLVLDKSSIIRKIK
jgi:hypothetical protein